MTALQSKEMSHVVKSGLLRAADERFGMGRKDGHGLRRGAYNQFYVDCPVHVTRGGLSARSGATGASCDPLIALLPELGLDRPNFGNMRRLEVPYVAFVVGQYGVGKTELIHQLGLAVEQSRDKDRPRIHILPVILADCRQQLERWRHDRSRAAAPYVFVGHLVNKLAGIRDADTLVADLMAAARAGEIAIALDAIDELASEPDAFGVFLEALSAVVAIGSPPGQPTSFRLILTTRLELLESLGYEDGIKIARLVGSPNSGADVYFVRLDLLGESEALDYLAIRLASVDRLREIESMATRLEILRMLQRPLLLRLFCDLCESKRGAQALLRDLAASATPATLIGRFVDQAIGDPDLVQQQTGILYADWNKDALADRTALLYRDSKQHFDIEDIKAFITPSTDTERLLDGGDRYLLGVHKCPFLLVDADRKIAEFAHRIFAEYFTALGLWRSQMAAEEARRSGTSTNFPMFDELVLNVDMRKLLRGIVIAASGGQPEAWYEQTRNSYGLNEPENWRERPASTELVRLDHVRRRILDIMTEADDTVRDRHHEIRTFFQLTDIYFHPRYAMFNYEGIAVYICLFKYREDEARRIDSEFSARLNLRLVDLLSRLRKSASESERRPYELLAERILSIALRLGYYWIETQFDLLASPAHIHSLDVFGRIRASIEQYIRMK